VLVILPADWSLDPPGSPNFLKGPAPDGNVRISLSMLESMDGNRRDRFLVAAADLAQKHPQRIQVRQLTSRNGMQILERVTYSSATGSPGAQLSAATLPSDKISWNLILFVPYEKRFIPCSFDLFGLTEDQYHNDQQFVEAIVDSAQPGTLQVAQ
jgi:hypothetical protein